MRIGLGKKRRRKGKGRKRIGKKRFLGKYPNWEFLSLKFGLKGNDEIEMEFKFKPSGKEMMN